MALLVAECRPVLEFDSTFVTRIATTRYMFRDKHRHQGRGYSLHVP
jgi:hypothetical protein